MTAKIQNTKYVLSDFIGSALAYAVFFGVRQVFFDLDTKTLDQIRPDKSFVLGITIVPVIWVLIFYISGYYRNTFRKSTINELSQTFFSVIIGSIFFFFAILLNDSIKTFSVHYISLLTLMGIEFVFVYIPRLWITNRFKQKIRKGTFGFRTILVGDIAEITEAIKELPKDLGNFVQGFVNASPIEKKKNNSGIPHLGHLGNLENIIAQNNIEEVILAFNNKHEHQIKSTLEILYRNNVFIRTTKTVSELLIGQVKLFPSYGTTFVEVIRDLMPPYEENLKRLIDVMVSAIVLVLLIPVFIYVIFRIKLNSKGPVFFKQKRAGLNRQPFNMYKFRSMYVDAEKDAPQLTEPSDTRVTPFGRFMRKYRIDELPQFWNVLKGDMSLVGPRPEREFFIQQIVEIDPNYLFLLKVRPGISSLGMVKFGYADNVNKMVERLKYDMIYIKNMSILFDFKVIIYTFRTIITGKGV